MTTKKMKQEIFDKYEAIPEKQIATGLFLHCVGSKYVHILNIWENTTIDKMEISEFYENYM